MARPSFLTLTIGAVLAYAVPACVSDPTGDELNPQPLPPHERAPDRNGPAYSENEDEAPTAGAADSAADGGPPLDAAQDAKDGDI
ncbi:MAG TPA: hypothetical protein VM580_22330 [Labilithrix sp.]|jgi:hypothetical protein|nr:hypothetical protein [Labilithrix sp.]